MGVRRYSRNDRLREERADEIRHLCGIDFYSPTIGELLDAGYVRAEWHCRKRGSCWHESQPFDLSRFKRQAKVSAIRRQFVCSECGTNRPLLWPLWDG